MLFVAGTVLWVVTLCVAACFPLNGVLGFSIGGSSADRHLWATHRRFVPGTSAAGCRAGVAGRLILLGGLDIEVTWPLHYVCFGRRAVSPSGDGEMLGSLWDGVLSGVLSTSELLQEFPHVRGMLHDVVMWDRGVLMWAAPTLTVPFGPGAWRPWGWLCICNFMLN
jgi:hypothetical protein